MRRPRLRECFKSWRGALRRSKGGVQLGSSLLMIGSSGCALACCLTLPYCLFCALAGSSSSSSAPGPLVHCSLSPLLPLVYTGGLFAALPLGALLDSLRGPQLPCLLGALLSFAACMSSSFSLHRLWVVLLALGFLNGAGGGLVLFSACTAPLRWETNPAKSTSLFKGPAIILGFLFFAPLSISLLETKTTNADKPLDAAAQLQQHACNLQFALRLLSGLAYTLQILGSLFIGNPTCFSRRTFQDQSGKSGTEEGTGVLLSPSEPSLQRDDSNYRLLYLTHLLSPFSLSAVGPTALKLQELYLCPQPASPWGPTAAGVSLRISQVVCTPRAWLFLGLGMLDACACSLLLTFWRLAVPPEISYQVQLATVLAGLFALLTPAFWAAFSSSSGSFAAVVLNQLVGATACACAAAAGLTQAAAFSQLSLALSLAFLVGSTTCLSRTLALAFGPHRLAFLLFGYACCCCCGGCAAAAAAAHVLLLLQRPLPLLFGAAAALVGASAFLLLFCRCCNRDLGRTLDSPVAYRLSFYSSEADEEDSGK
ncbi:hypothetical protein Esti_006353 [Eimeria stiedai]